MDSIVEENGNSNHNVDEGGHNLSTTHQAPPPSHGATSATQQSLPPPSTGPPTASAASVLTATSNVHYISQPVHGLQSVIQANQSSVIQTAATNAHSVSLAKGNLVFVPTKPNTVIHPTPGNAVQFPPQFSCKIKNEPNSHQNLDTNSEDSLSEEDSPRGVKEIKRRPSYNKIFNDISGPDITAGAHLQMTESGGLQTIACTGGSTAGTTIMHLPQDNPAQQFYLPNRIQYNTNNTGIAEDQTRKREIRLQKNREAARECRRKKKEYIKCLENRVAVLENQNKALIEELKSLKELYCQTKND